LQGILLKTNPRTLSIAVAKLHCSRRRVRKCAKFNDSFARWHHTL